MDRESHRNREKRVPSSPVSFAHRAWNLLLKEFYVQAHVLQLPKTFGNSNRNPLAAQDTV